MGPSHVKNTFVSALSMRKGIPCREDKFPNGRPRLEESGVIFTDRKLYLLLKE